MQHLWGKIQNSKVKNPKIQAFCARKKFGVWSKTSFLPMETSVFIRDLIQNSKKRNKSMKKPFVAHLAQSLWTDSQTQSSSNLERTWCAVLVSNKHNCRNAGFSAPGDDSAPRIVAFWIPDNGYFEFDSFEILSSTQTPRDDEPPRELYFVFRWNEICASKLHVEL